jgi:hypothetical protein
MHVVAAAWLFVIGMIAVASGSALGGIALFVVAGVAPVLFVAWIAARRAAARRDDARRR